VKANYQQHSGKLACLAIYIALFSLAISRIIVNQALIIAVLCMLARGNWRADWQYVWQFRFIKLMFAFLALIVLGIFYSQVPFEPTLEGFGKYGKLLFIPFFLPLFKEARVRSNAVTAFLAGVFFCLVLNTLHHYHLLDLTIWANHAKWFFSQYHPGGTFINPIPFSVLEAFAAYVILTKVLHRSRSKILYIILFGLVSYHLFFINIERTGMLCYMFLLGLFILQRIQWQKALLLIGLIVPMLFALAYYGSANFAKRIELIQHDIYAYHAGKVDTSIGLRFSFWLNTWQLIKQAPFLGHGTGSFQTVYAKTAGITATPGVQLGDPHNEYILVAMQWGSIGLLIYLSWFFSQYREAQCLPLMERRLLEGLIVTILVSSLTHVVMYTNATGTLFVLGVCCLFGAMPVAKKN
jgi:O-antigen ligase